MPSVAEARQAQDKVVQDFFLQSKRYKVPSTKINTNKEIFAINQNHYKYLMECVVVGVICFLIALCYVFVDSRELF